ncbi:zinc-binding dehydrogenase [Nocardioides sp. GXQ0305]|uniref:zinc-binding dehydrogenase n=1 Tax=Nocardioides sp. GXQ0305 TaxID=3423912 RepID=UPI003D7D5C10
MADMTAVVLPRHGGPEVLEVRHDWPRPVPGPGQVLVKVAAAGMNNTDLWTREGAYGLPGPPSGWRGPIAFPRVQGGDVCGVVAEVGAEVAPSRVGERVLVDPALYRDETPTAPIVGVLGSESDGGFAEYVVTDDARAHDVSESPLDDDQLAALPIAYGTAVGMLERAAVGAGETVLVTGASGGVGLALVQLAVARGARVVAVSSGAKAAQVLDAGAHRVVDRGGDLAAQVADAAPDGLDAVADVAGGPLLDAILPLLRTDGRWVIAGAIAGPVVELDLRRLYLRNLTLIGSTMHTREHFARLVDEARAGTIAPVVAARYPLAQIAEAQQAFRRAEHVGKIVLSLG